MQEARLRRSPLASKIASIEPLIRARVRGGIRTRRQEEKVAYNVVRWYLR
jgi:hypothetical protein